MPALDAVHENDTFRPDTVAEKLPGGPGIGVGTSTTIVASGDGVLDPIPFTARTRA